MVHKNGTTASERNRERDPGYYRTGSSVEELTRRNVQIVVDLEEAAMANRSTSDRLIDAVTCFCGSVPFVWVHLLWFGGWILANTLPGLPRFDPFPFGLLTMIVSLEAILLSTFILITQNRHARIDERRNHLDLQIDLLSEQENTKILALLHAMARKMGVDGYDDPEIRALEREVQVDSVVKQIKRNIEHGGDAGTPEVEAAEEKLDPRETSAAR